MRSGTVTVLLIAALLFSGFAILVFGSVTATDCVARFQGGSGTVADPLRIRVEGNAGWVPLIDSILPFRAIPAVHLSYAGEGYYVPGLNRYFIGYQGLANVIYLVAILLFVFFAVWLALRLAGKRLALVDIRAQKSSPQPQE